LAPKRGARGGGISIAGVRADCEHSLGTVRVKIAVFNLGELFHNICIGM